MFVYWFLQVDWRSWADVSHQMWLRHLSLWVCTFFSFSFFSFLFFFLGLYIFFLATYNISNRDCIGFQNQVWPVQSRLKRCDVSPTDEQVYNEMNIIHFFASQHDAKKAKKWYAYMNEEIHWSTRTEKASIHYHHHYHHSGGEPQRWTTWRWQQGERILMRLKHSLIWKNFTEKAVSQIHRRRELEYKQIDSQTNWQILIINLNNL